LGAGKTGAIKQRSPAGPRWAGNQLHQIEKMHHRESSILRGIPIPVKLTGEITAMTHMPHFNVNGTDRDGQSDNCDAGDSGFQVVFLWF
jgi:hypothetical protein